MTAHLQNELDITSVMTGRLGTPGIPLLEYLQDGMMTLLSRLTQYADQRINHPAASRCPL